MDYQRYRTRISTKMMQNRNVQENRGDASNKAHCMSVGLKWV